MNIKYEIQVSEQGLTVSEYRKVIRLLERTLQGLTKRAVSRHGSREACVSWTGKKEHREIFEWHHSGISSGDVGPDPD